ncbi:MAG: toll/interleukin-1 receptor domain-containing protein [Promethearchaeota archaeon]
METERLCKVLGKKGPSLPDLPRGMTIRQYYAKTYGQAYEPFKKSVYKKGKDRVKVFVSHPNGHELVCAKMHELSDYLRKRGKKRYSPWCDKDKLGPSGQELDRDMIRAMIQALEEADLVVVGLPAGWKVSNWIIAENRQAKAMKKRILVVFFGKAKMKAGMARSAGHGYVRVGERSQVKWKQQVLEAIERVMAAGLKYEEF